VSHTGGELLLGGVASAEPDALGVGDQVRREIRASRVPLCLKRPSERDGGGALAVGPDDLNGSQSLLRVIQRGQKLLGAFESERDPEPAIQLVADFGVGEGRTQGYR
jgi:hypothetical protein